MSDDIEQIIDLNGDVRRLGSLCPDAGMLQAWLEAPMVTQELTDGEIRDILADPDRKPSRVIFDASWIQDQRSHGSCNGYATAACLARARYRAGVRDGIKHFSGAYLYSWMNGGRDQGSNLSEGLKVIEQRGAPPESLVPWNQIYRNQTQSADSQASLYKGLHADPVKTIQALKSALAMGHPCVVAIHAGGNCQRLDANGVAGVDSGRGNHAVAVDDIRLRNGQIEFDMVNSWSTRYGQQGRAWLTERHFAQTFGVHTFWRLASIVEGK